MATLGQAFNHMDNSLQQAEESRRIMTAILPHERRTPPAVQRANLEALQDGVYPVTVENLSPIVEQNHLLTHLVEDLRTLALADAGHRAGVHPHQLTCPGTAWVEQLQRQAAKNQVSLHFSSPATPMQLISLDPIRLEQILTNLLTNALRYTPQAGQIEVAINPLPKFAPSDRKRHWSGHPAGRFTVYI